MTMGWAAIAPPRTATLATELVLLFCVTLEVPGISSAAAFLLAFAGVFRWAVDPALDRGHGFRLLLLALFAAAYYLTMFAYGWYDATASFRYFVAIVALYALGYAAGAEPAAVMLWKLLALAGGCVAFTFLSVRAALAEAGTLAIALVQRVAPSYWTGVPYNAPALGAFASLGMCLLPVVLQPGLGPARSGVAARVVALVLALAGIYSNVALQNRTPYVALAASIVSAFLVLPFLRGSSVRMRLTAVLLLPLLALFALELDTVVDLMGERWGVVWRFSESGLQTERYATWGRVLTGLPSHLGGGRAIDLGAAHFAHNLWLDVAWDVGVLPLALLLAFHLSHLGIVWRATRGDAPPALIVALVGLGCSCLATFVAEPTLTLSPTYFAATCFFLGLASRLSRRARDEATCPSS